MWTEDPNPMFGASLPQFLMAICTLAVPWMLPLGPESELTWPILAYFHGFSQDFLRDSEAVHPEPAAAADAA